MHRVVFTRLSALALCALLAAPAFAQVSVKDAWVRASVPQQKATGAFTSTVSRFPSLLSTMRVSVTVCPAVSARFRSIIITW